MVSGDTSADNNVSGYARAESITLSITEASATYAWALSKPAASTAACELTDDTIAAPKFVPDVPGDYLVTVTTAATSYVLRISVVDLGDIVPLEIIRWSPLNPASVPTPSGNEKYMFLDSTTGELSLKDDTGTVTSLE